MGIVRIEMSMSLDGFVAGPDDGPGAGLGRRGGEHVFDWYEAGGEPVGGVPVFRAAGPDRRFCEEAIARTGAMVFGRRTYDITRGWGGSHPVRGMPLVILTHRPPPPEAVPRGDSPIRFEGRGIEAALRLARDLAGGRDVSLGGASPCRQALAAGLVDEILVHVAPILLGAGVRLFDDPGVAIRLEPLESQVGHQTTHLRYRVLR